MKSDLDYVAHINKYCHEITQFVSGLSFDEFCGDMLTNKSSAFTIMLIVESTRKISDAFKGTYPNIPWRKVTGMGDVVFDTYHEINCETLWQIIRDNVPELLEFTDEILKK